jgi:hypothetical protein
MDVHPPVHADVDTERYIWPSEIGDPESFNLEEFHTLKYLLIHHVSTSSSLYQKHLEFDSNSFPKRGVITQEQWFWINFTCPPILQFSGSGFHFNPL